VQTHPTWLFKAFLNGALVDVLYRLGRKLSLDEEMLERASMVDVDGRTVPIISREDLAIGQAGVSSREVPDYWFQAVDLLRADGVDWDYVSRRASAAPDRMVALLHYARSEGIGVPKEAFPR
jgi:predicted nucleotidyltransferase